MQGWSSTWAEIAPSVQALAWNVVGAVLILIVGWWVSARAGQALLKVSKRPGSRIDVNIVPMAHSIVVWSIRVVVLLAVLARLGVQTASLIAVLGAAGLAIGMALQGTLQNIAAGIMLLALRPLKAGEFVSIVGKGDGTVLEVGLFLTRLVQIDGVHITLPNSLVWGNPVINYSRNETRRLDFDVTVRHGDDVALALDELRRLVTGHPAVQATPAPMVVVTNYCETGIVVSIRAWTLVGVYWDTVFELRREAPLALARAGLKVPIPVREVQTRVVDADGTGATEAKAPEEKGSDPATLGSGA